MSLPANQKTQNNLLVMMLLAIFALVSLRVSQVNDARYTDFAAYWQAGNMILQGRDVYDSEQWRAESDLHGTAQHGKPPFHYPLPFAVLLAPFGFLSVDTAYTVWLVICQISIVSATILLWKYYPSRTGYIEILIIAGVFLFRPAFISIINGQIAPVLLLLACLSVVLFEKQRWYWGGVLLSAFSLKPSLGLFILIFAGMWMLFRRQWKGLAGLASGGVALFALGALVKPGWVIEFANIGSDAFGEYLSLYPTLWGAVDHLLAANNGSIVPGIVFAGAVFVVEAYVLQIVRVKNEPAYAFATLISAGLLIAPYAWSYDQILLVFPMIFFLCKAASRYGNLAAMMVLASYVALSIALVGVAVTVRHDVWSFLNSFLLWVVGLYFVRVDMAIQVRMNNGTVCHPER